MSHDEIRSILRGIGAWTIATLALLACSKPGHRTVARGVMIPTSEWGNRAATFFPDPDSSDPTAGEWWVDDRSGAPCMHSADFEANSWSELRDRLHVSGFTICSGEYVTIHSKRAR
jgi:hypothetical protein